MNSYLAPIMSSFCVANLRNSPAIMCDLRLEPEHSGSQSTLSILNQRFSGKGWLAVFLIFILPLPQPVYAEAASLIDNKHLWFSPDQKAMKAFNAGDIENAAKTFTHPQWKASAYFQKGDYEAAASVFDQIPKDNRSSSSYYNKANALAKLGQFDNAIKAYDKALELDENNDDAIYNREQVKQALQEQQKQEQQGGEQQNKDSENQSGENQQQDSSQQDSNKNDSSQPDSAQKNTNQQQPGEASDQQKPETDSEQQKQAENEQLKQRDAQAEAKKQQAEQEAYQQQQKKNESLENTQDENKNAEGEPPDQPHADPPLKTEVNPTEASITEEEKATAQWLKRIPDDPGGLLRRKFYYQHRNNPDQNDNNEPW